MITGKVFFDNKNNAIKSVDFLLDLPEAIKPVYYTADEGRINKSNLVLNVDKYEEFKNKNPLGFMLYVNKDIYFDISLGEGDYCRVDLYSEVELAEELIVSFFEVLAQSDPFFGLGCEIEEYEHRNITFKQIGANAISSWVGRDLKKYVSGVYWYTFFSDRILDAHGIDLATLLTEAVKIHLKGNSGLHLLRFFESSKDWVENRERLDSLCEKVDGVFSKKSIDNRIENIDNYLEYSAALREWR